jgi:hypothetical protein
MLKVGGYVCAWERETQICLRSIKFPCTSDNLIPEPSQSSYRFDLAHSVSWETKMCLRSIKFPGKCENIILGPLRSSYWLEHVILYTPVSNSLICVSNKVKPSASTYNTLDENFGNDRSLLHSFKKIMISLESWEMLSG